MLVSVLLFVWKALGAVAACVTLPGSLELFALSAAALVPVRREMHEVAPARWRTAVLVPAHDERLCIAACVETLLASQPSSLDFEVFVVADNCTDDTAAVAAGAGAQVFERTDPEHRGKGYALHWAFSRLIDSGFDCILIVDADTHVEPSFVALASGTLRQGAHAVQAGYMVRNEPESSSTRRMNLALRLFNIVRPLGREHLGLSCGISGTGFGLRTDTLLAVPYLASSIVEDLEYHIALVRSGRRVRFLRESTVLAEAPVRRSAVEGQRSRWEGGRIRMLLSQAPALLCDVLRGKLRCIEPLFDLLLLPLAYHAILLLLAATAPLPFARYAGLAGLAIVLLHLAAGLTAGGGGWNDVKAIASVPLYVLWKLKMIPALLRSARPDRQWVRTLRNAEQSESERP